MLFGCGVSGIGGDSDSANDRTMSEENEWMEERIAALKEENAMLREEILALDTDFESERGGR